MIAKNKLLTAVLILLLFTFPGCKKASAGNSQDGTLKEYPSPDVNVSVFEYDRDAHSFQDKEFLLSENEKAYLYHIISTARHTPDVLKSSESGDYLIIIGEEEWHYIQYYSAIQNYDRNVHIALSEEQNKEMKRILPNQNMLSP